MVAVVCGLAVEDLLDFVQHLVGFEGVLKDQVAEEDLGKDLVALVVLCRGELFFAFFLFVEIAENIVFFLNDLGIDVIFLTDPFVGKAFKKVAESACVFLPKGVTCAGVVSPRGFVEVFFADLVVIHPLRDCFVLLFEFGERVVARVAMGRGA